MAKKLRRRKAIGYLRVSTVDQDLDKFKADILRFANDKDFGRVSFVEEKVSGKKPWRERKIKSVIDSLKSGDRLLVPELSRLGRSTLEVLEILKEARDRSVDVYSVKENISLNGNNIQAKVMATVLALVAELERDFISMRTKEGLRAARAKGKLLGRPKGPGKSKLDAHREEIVALLKNGSTKAYVAKRYNTTQPNLWHWLKKHDIDATPQFPK
jgi:DNA invertase Pin-like site-specific DNA recombinase